jgi:hypothetical protein
MPENRKENCFTLIHSSANFNILDGLLKVFGKMCTGSLPLDVVERFIGDA